MDISTMLVLALIVGALIVFILQRFRHKKYRLPPGPPGLPFIGNVHQLDNKRPHVTITQWSEQYGDVFKMEAFGATSVILNSFDTIYEGLVTQANTFAGRPKSYRNSAANLHSPDIVASDFSKEWIFRKKLSMQTLKMYGDHLEYLETLSLDLIDDMLNEMKGIASKGPTDIYPFFSKCVGGIISSLLFGEKVDVGTLRSMLGNMNDLLEIGQPSGKYLLLDMLPILQVVPNPWNNRLLRAAKEFRAVVNHKINPRRTERQIGQPQCWVDGILDHQKKSQETGTEMTISDDVISGLTADLFFAGIFTTSTTLNGLIAVLCNKPMIQEELFKEINREIGEREPKLSDKKILHYVDATIYEILRYSSIVPLDLPHSPIEDAHINGYDIPKGTMVLFNLWKLHHDPKYWDEPWEFKPERFLDENGKVVPADHKNRRRLLAFGASRRVCLGEVIAKNRLFLMVTSLVQHFRFLPAGPDERPLHDPRDYKYAFTIAPYNYRVRLQARR